MYSNAVDLFQVVFILLYRQVMFQLFQAVEHMHSHHLIHRDLKVRRVCCVYYDILCCIALCCVELCCFVWLSDSELLCTVHEA